VFGFPSANSSVTGLFDFDAGGLDLDFQGLTFYGMPILYTGGSLAGNGDGTHDGTLVFDWSTTTGNTASILWGITDNGNGTATVVTLDGDEDGIPGNAITEGSFSGGSFEINGQLTAVLLPAAFWLMGSGMLCLVRWRRRAPA